MHRRKIVGVMGSGSQAHEEASERIGRLLAQMGFHLLTGGGAGVMAAVSRAFAETPGRAGLVLGVLPSRPSHSGQPPAGYPNPWVEIVIRTHLPLSGAQGTDALSRNHINILSSDAILVLPGSLGTSSEAALALRYGKPILAFLKRRQDVPQLPESIRVVSHLKEVEQFLNAAL